MLQGTAAGSECNFDIDRTKDDGQRCDGVGGGADVRLCSLGSKSETSQRKDNRAETDLGAVALQSESPDRNERDTAVHGTTQERKNKIGDRSLRDEGDVGRSLAESGMAQKKVPNNARSILKPYYDENGITIYHGDCREVLPTLEYIFFCLTDPPFGIGELTGGYGRAQNHGGHGRTIIGDKDLSVLQDIAPILYRGIGEPGWLVTFCGARRMLETGQLFKDAGFDYYGELIWDKGAPGLGFTIRYAHESMLVFRKGNAEREKDAVISIQREAVDRIATQLRHPHEKPVSIMKSILKLGSGVVLDPFMGSGSVLRAAKDLGRKAIGIEIEEKYCEMAVKLLKQETLALT